jgi:membrane protease YdiL (CAAX protease family)
MKNVTKANVLFTATVLVYIILMYSLQLTGFNELPFNIRLVIPEIILLVPALLYVVILRPSTVDGVSMSVVSPLTTILTVILTFCIMPLVMVINTVSSLIGGNEVDSVMNELVLENPLWMNLIIIALLPAVVEEFIFRGLLFNGYKKRNPLMAILLSAFLFGLMHMNLNQFSYAFVIGIIFGFLAYATGSLLPSILGHFIINGTSVVITHFSSGATQEPVATDITMQVAQFISAIMILGVVAVAGTVIAFFVFWAICYKNRGFESVKRLFLRPLRTTFVEEEGKFMDGYLILGMTICVVHIILRLL